MSENVFGKNPASETGMPHSENTTPTPTARSIGQVVAVLPRLVGYVPTGRVTLLPLSDRGAVLSAACLDAADVEDEPSRVSLLGWLVQVRGRAAVARVLVIGWRGNTPVRDETTRLVDDLILAGEPVEAWLTDGRSVRPLGPGRREPVPALTPDLAGVGPAPATDREALARAWRPVGAAAPVPTPAAQAWGAWERVVAGVADATDAGHAAGALSDPAFRDQMLTALTGITPGLLRDPQAHAVAAHREHHDLPERLRQSLALLAPVPQAAPFVALCGWVTYLRGAGTATATLLEVGADLDPDNRLLDLLGACYGAGLDPAAVARDLSH